MWTVIVLRCKDEARFESSAFNISTLQKTWWKSFVKVLRKSNCSRERHCWDLIRPLLASVEKRRGELRLFIPTRFGCAQHLSPPVSGWGGYQCRKYHADPCGIRHIYHISYICRHIQIYIYIHNIYAYEWICIYIYISHIHHWYIVHKPTHQKTCIGL